MPCGLDITLKRARSDTGGFLSQKEAPAGGRKLAVEGGGRRSFYCGEDRVPLAQTRGA